MVRRCRKPVAESHLTETTTARAEPAPRSSLCVRITTSATDFSKEENEVVLSMLTVSWHRLCHAPASSHHAELLPLRALLPLDAQSLIEALGPQRRPPALYVCFRTDRSACQA